MQVANDREQLEKADALLKEALKLLDDQRLLVAAAHLSGVIEMVDQALIGRGGLVSR